MSYQDLLKDDIEVGSQLKSQLCLHGKEMKCRRKNGRRGSYWEVDQVYRWYLYTRLSCG